MPSESGVGVLCPPHRAPPPASVPPAPREEPGLRAAGGRPPPPPAFVSALHFLSLFSSRPGKPSFVAPEQIGSLPPASGSPSAGRRPHARRPSQPIPARERLGEPVGGGARRVVAGGARPASPTANFSPSPGPSGAGRGVGVALGGRARAACGRPRAASGLAGGGRGAGVTTAARGSGRSRRGRTPDAPRGACAPGARRPAHRPPASSGRHAEPSPGKSGARAAGPGRRWRPPGTLGLWTVGDGAPGVRALREHPDGSRGRIRNYPGNPAAESGCGRGTPPGTWRSALPFCAPRPAAAIRVWDGRRRLPPLPLPETFSTPASARPVGGGGEGPAWKDRAGVGGRRRADCAHFSV